MNNKYFLLRHGQTIYQTEKKDILYSWPETASPVRLTKKGEEQIKERAKELKGKIDLIFSSDIFRTRQTAEIISKEIGLEVNFDIRLRDIDQGIFHGGPKKKFQEFFSERKEKFSKPPPQGESWNDLKKRISEFLEEVERKYKGKNILIISHGDPLWFLAGMMKGIKKEEDFLKEKHKGLYPDVGQLMTF